jgi:hypothetical protein
LHSISARSLAGQIAAREVDLAPTISARARERSKKRNFGPFGWEPVDGVPTGCRHRGRNRPSFACVTSRIYRTRACKKSSANSTFVDPKDNRLDRFYPERRLTRTPYEDQMSRWLKLLATGAHKFLPNNYTSKSEEPW